MDDPPESLPEARTTTRRRISAIWLIPLLAAAIGGWLAWDTLSKQGPTVRVTFDSAEGLQPGQSPLKYRDVVFGKVKKIELTPDKWHVVVTIDTTREAEPLLTDKTVFWVVKPRLFAGNISGLDTVLSGSYISLVPGEGGKPKRDFIGQEDPPILTAHVPGRVFQLKSPRIGSISVGSPVFFRDMSVGEVLGWDVSSLADSVTIRAFVRAPYDTYVHNETRFWNASGLSVNLGAEGVQIKMESLRALLFGGIAFDTPSGEARAGRAAENHEFPLFIDRDAANAASYTRTIAGVSYFTGSVRGLAAGSEVSMHGLKIGEVTGVRLVADPEKATIRAQVRYQVQPERIVGTGKRLVQSDADAVGLMLGLGLRASLESANLITGQQTLALSLNPNLPASAVVKEGGDFVIPSTESGGFSGLTASAGELLDELKAIPYADIGAGLKAIPYADIGTSLKAILQSVDKATEGPELKAAVNNLNAALASAQKALVHVDKLAVSVDSGYGGDTKFYRDLDRLLVQTDEAVRSIRALSDLLSRHPESLIKGRKE